MLTTDQVTNLTKQYKINEATIVREYFQLVFLRHLYNETGSNRIFFKGGTAVHLVYKAPRFSEDLDFTVNMDENDFIILLENIIRSFQHEEEVAWKERKTITGRRFLLTFEPAVVSYQTYINLDFSFREIVLHPQKSILETAYPVLFTTYVHHLSAEEIAAEKIRAIMTRRKGRDVYDLWYLLTKNVSLNNTFVREKLKYYSLTVKREDIIQRIASFNAKDFILDVRPFVPVNEREKLPEFFKYVQDYIQQKL